MEYATVAPSYREGFVCYDDGFLFVYWGEWLIADGPAKFAQM